MKYIFFVLLILLSTYVYPQEQKLSPKAIFTEVIPTSKSALKTSFSRDSLPYWGVIIGSTGILYHYDEKIYSDSQRKGRAWGIGNEDNTRPLISAFGHDVVRLPSDTGSALYFLGDGWLHASIAGGFVGYGQLAKNTKAFNTGIILAHGMVVSTIFNQTLKRSFGRESPEVKTSKRGSWNLFPNFDDYNSKTASYDAMPSGHIMTATMTFTVLTERYSEYNSYLYPLAGLWIGALGFQMMNNGVHWASDYPLGIAMGYVFGKASTKIVKVQEDGLTEEQKQTSWLFLPTFSSDSFLLSATKRF